MRKVCCKAAIAPQDSRIEKMPTPTIQKMNVFPLFLVKGYLECALYNMKRHAAKVQVLLALKYWLVLKLQCVFYHMVNWQWDCRHRLVSNSIG